MATRWQCPSDKHPGALAPERMRRNDVRRFCIPCSVETGFLVERVSPKLEKRRATAALRSATKAQAKRESQRDRRIVRLRDALGRERELDVRAELKRALTDMGFFEGWLMGRPTMDELEIKIRRGNKSHHTGRAVEAGFWVTFTFGRNGSYEEGLAIIYHEAAHLSSYPGDHHSPRFQRILADAMQKRWPFLRFGALNHRSCMDGYRAVRGQLLRHVENGGVL